LDVGDPEEEVGGDSLMSPWCTSDLKRSVRSLAFGEFAFSVVRDMIRVVAVRGGRVRMEMYNGAYIVVE
jgi:hypothetical protein